jgi:hypothetical protein
LPIGQLLNSTKSLLRRGSITAAARIDYCSSTRVIAGGKITSAPLLSNSAPLLSNSAPLLSNYVHIAGKLTS